MTTKEAEITLPRRVNAGIVRQPAVQSRGALSAWHHPEERRQQNKGKQEHRAQDSTMKRVLELHNSMRLIMDISQLQAGLL